jgi:hypothetical protein
MRSWHDYHITGYFVEGERRRITFDVSWPYDLSTDIKRTSIVFSGVEGYFFEHDLGVNVLYSISEEQLEAFLSQNAERFEKERKWGWPLFWRGAIGTTLEHLNSRNVKCFAISSSYGLSGWVLASRVDHYAVAANDSPDETPYSAS